MVPLCARQVYIIIYINIYIYIAGFSDRSNNHFAYLSHSPDLQFFSNLFSLTLFIARLRVDPFEEYANQIYILHYINYNTTYLLTVCNRFFFLVSYFVFAYNPNFVK